MQRRLFLIRSAALTAALAVQSGRSIAHTRITGATVRSRPDGSWSIGAPGGCATYRGRSHRQRMAGGYTLAELTRDER